MTTLTITTINFETGQIDASPITKSEIFSWYNRARKAANQGKIDRERLNRAFGYLLSGKAAEKWAEYHTTVSACDCPDAKYRPQHGPCKHRTAKMIEYRIIENRQAKVLA